jgi:hypothetical protein
LDDAGDFLDRENRPAFDLVINAPEVFPDNTKAK